MVNNVKRDIDYASESVATLIDILHDIDDAKAFRKKFVELTETELILKAAKIDKENLIKKWSVHVQFNKVEEALEKNPVE